MNDPAIGNEHSGELSDSPNRRRARLAAAAIEADDFADLECADENAEDHEGRIAPPNQTFLNVESATSENRPESSAPPKKPPSGGMHNQLAKESTVLEPDLDFEGESPESLVERAIKLMLPEQVESYVIAKLKEAGLINKAAKFLDKGDPQKALNLLRKHVPRSMDVFRQAQAKNLSGKRTRFLVKYAKSDGPRMSALLFFIAVCTQQEYKRGARGDKCCWHSTAARIGHEIGVSKYEILKMLKKANAKKLLDFGKTTRGIRIWLTRCDIYLELNRHCKADQTKHIVGYYNVKLSTVLGINGSIFYCFLKKKTDDCGEHLTYSPDSIVLRFPWLSINAARCALERLYEMGAIDRRQSNWHVERGRIAWRYFWKPRRETDRAKWRTYRGKKPRRVD